MKQSIGIPKRIKHALVLTVIKYAQGVPTMKQALLNLQASAGPKHTVCIQVLNTKHARAPNAKYTQATIKRGGSQV